MAPTKIKLEVYRAEDWEQNDGMLKWGSILLLGSTAAFVLGVWAIAVAPFMDPTGISVRRRRFVPPRLELNRPRCSMRSRTTRTTSTSASSSSPSRSTP